MPAYMSHYICGLKAYRRLQSGALKNLIKKYRSVYGMGLAGPDLFFYSPADVLFHEGEKSRGSVLHEERTGAFLQKLYEEAVSCRGSRREIGLAYFAGFLGHYALDVHCHPMVYRHIGAKGKLAKEGEHFRYEGAMEVYACRHYLHRELTRIRMRQLTALDGEERRVLAAIAANAYNAVYDTDRLTTAKADRIFRLYPMITLLIRDPSGLKEGLLSFLERLVLKTVFVSPLFVNQNTYRLTPKDWESFRRCMEKGFAENTALLLAMEQSLTPSLESRGEEKERFFRRVGNRSYHTGESVAQGEQAGTLS